MSQELSFIPAAELARMIREKTVSPLEVMRETIARAEALNPRLNAICTPTFDAAMEAASEAEDAVMRGRPSGNPARRADQHQGPRAYARCAHHGRIAHPSRPDSGLRPSARRTPARSRCHLDRQDDGLRIWLERCQQEPAHRHHAQSVEARHERRRIQRRRGRLRGGGDRTDPSGLGWRRIGAHAGRVLRHLRHQALARASSLLADPGKWPDLACRAADAHGCRRGPDVAGNGGSRRSRHGQPRSPAGRFRRASRRRHCRPEGRLQPGPRISEGGCGSGRAGPRSGGCIRGTRLQGRGDQAGLGQSDRNGAPAFLGQLHRPSRSFAR